MKLLALATSPRKNGNTDLLIDSLLHGLQEADNRPDQNRFDVEKLYLIDFNIAPCYHCDRCLKTGQCPVSDDMSLLYEKLRETDWLIFASPIYFMAHSAWAKILIDRCQVFWAQKYILKQSLYRPGKPPRRGIFVSVGATHGPKVFAGAKVTMQWFFDSLQMEYWADLLFEGIDAKGAIQQHPSALQDALALGQKIARTP